MLRILRYIPREIRSNRKISIPTKSLNIAPKYFNNPKNNIRRYNSVDNLDMATKYKNLKIKYVPYIKSATNLAATIISIPFIIVLIMLLYICFVLGCLCMAVIFAVLSMITQSIFSNDLGIRYMSRLFFHICRSCII